MTRRKFIVLFLETPIRIWILYEFSWSFRLQSWCTGSILWSNFLFQESKISPHQWRQLLEFALVLFLSTVWIWKLSMFGSHSWTNSGLFYCQFYFKKEVHLPIVWGSCSNSELIQILLIIWIAVWRYFIITFYFK